jgi:hypothetical protein
MYCSAGRYVDNEVSEKSTIPQRTAVPYSDIVECELLLDSLDMFRFLSNNFYPRTEGL